MNYKLAKKLKDAGFPQQEFDFAKNKVEEAPNDIAPYKWAYPPTLSELLEACGDKFESLSYVYPKSEDTTNTEWLEKGGRWCAVAMEQGFTTIADTNGFTPEEAVANLWLELNKK